MGIADNIKSAGIGIGGLVVVLIMGAISLIFIYGMTWVSVKVLPWLSPVFFGTLAVCFFLLGPLALLKKTRGFAAVGLLMSSYVLGIILWIWSLLLTFDLWGMIAVVIGLLFFGVGIVLVALLAAIFHADWPSLGDLAFMIVITFGIRVFAIWLGNKAGMES